MVKSLDRKLAAIHTNPNCREFILADAKDADMVLGFGAPGRSPELHAGEVRVKTLEEYREQMRLITRQGLVDIMLMSASTNYALTFRERLFDDSSVTPAVRANDTTDIHLARGATDARHTSHPFRAESLDPIQRGHLVCSPEKHTLGANLGLYSVTFNNDLARDLATLERFHQFRAEAERNGFRYFLEVFDPHVPSAVAPDVLTGYINDMITRILDGVAPSGRPLFLKLVYHGPKAMEELIRFNPRLVIGILGGSAGTTRDAFQLLHDAQSHGAKVALFGRKINNAENQLAFVQFLRLIVEGVIGPADAVKAYHAVLGKLGIKAHRSLDDDLKLTDQSMSNAGATASVTVPPKPRPAEPAPTAGAAEALAWCCRTTDHAARNGHLAQVVTTGNRRQYQSHERAPDLTASRNGKAESDRYPKRPDGLPDFSKMDALQRLAYHRQRLGLGC